MNDRDPSTALGETIRAQRQRSQLPMRTLAERVGISNPYLSQIERGLRVPSDQVLDSIARALKTTSRALHEAAGLTPPGPEADDVPDPPVLIALREDTLLSDNQRRALAAVYRAFTEGKAQMRRRRRRRLAAAPAAVAAAAEAAAAAVEAAAAADAAAAAGAVAGAAAGAAAAAAAEAVVASGHEPDDHEPDDHEPDDHEPDDEVPVNEPRTDKEPEDEPG